MHKLKLVLLLLRCGRGGMSGSVRRPSHWQVLGCHEHLALSASRRKGVLRCDAAVKSDVEELSEGLRSSKLGIFVWTYTATTRSIQPHPKAEDLCTTCVERARDDLG